MIHLLVGNTGSGKTTYANKLKHELKAVIFSIDSWNRMLFLPDKTDADGLDWFLERIDRSEAMIQNLAVQLDAIGVDVILDLGFSKSSHREKFRIFAQEKRIAVQLHFLDIPKKTRKERIVKRNTEKGATFEFEVSNEDFEFMESWFESPLPEEMKCAVVIKE